jgi:hypothetical protein
MPINATFVRGVRDVHVVSEFIETGSDGGHVLPARAKLRRPLQTDISDTLDHCLFYRGFTMPRAMPLRGISDKRMEHQRRATALLHHHTRRHREGRAQWVRRSAPTRKSTAK